MAPWVSERLWPPRRADTPRRAQAPRSQRGRTTTAAQKPPSLGSLSPRSSRRKAQLRLVDAFLGAPRWAAVVSGASRVSTHRYDSA
eukprot:5837934-Pyramimonas_sp.AAC.1